MGSGARWTIGREFTGGIRRRHWQGVDGAQCARDQQKDDQHCCVRRIPFYIAAPVTTIDTRLADGCAIPIEERSPTEVTHFQGQQVAAPGIHVRPAEMCTDCPPCRRSWHSFCLMSDRLPALKLGRKASCFCNMTPIMLQVQGIPSS